MPAGVAAVGRPKKNREPDETPRERNDRETVIHLKGSPEYVDWLEAAYKKTHIAKASMVRLGLILFAKEHGLPEPPEI